MSRMSRIDTVANRVVVAAQRVDANRVGRIQRNVKLLADLEKALQMINEVARDVLRAYNDSKDPSKPHFFDDGAHVESKEPGVNGTLALYIQSHQIKFGIIQNRHAKKVTEIKLGQNSADGVSLTLDAYSSDDLEELIEYALEHLADEFESAAEELS
jgi:hypothetical protein